MKEQFELESLLPEPKNCFERSNFFKMPYRVFCNLVDTLVRFRTNQEVMMFTDKKKLHTCSYSVAGISQETKETKVILPQ